MEIGAMLDELREKALKDRNIWQQLMDTRKEKQPLDAFCVKSNAANTLPLKAHGRNALSG